MTDTRETTAERESALVTSENRKVTFSYSRKVSDGDFGSEEVSIFLTDDVPDDVNALMFVAEQAETALNGLKAQVWDALGLAFSYSETGQPVLDKPKPPRPVDNTSPPPPAPAQQGQQAPPAQPPPVEHTRGAGKDQPSMAQVGYYAEFPGFCKDCGAQGIGNFYDNRGDVDQRIAAREKIGPDFKCKNCGGGNGKGKPLYRPGSYDYNQAIKNQSAPPAQAPPPVEPPY